MGGLHQGHARLIGAAVKDQGSMGPVLVSTFINPLQFGVDEDFDRYPRTFEADCTLTEQAGATALWSPDERQVYPYGDSEGWRLQAPSLTVAIGVHLPLIRRPQCCRSRLFGERAVSLKGAWITIEVFIHSELQWIDECADQDGAHRALVLHRRADQTGMPLVKPPHGGNKGNGGLAGQTPGAKLRSRPEDLKAQRSTSSFTWATPLDVSPRCLAAPWPKSITRWPTNGPRSLMRTTALRPFQRLVTRTLVPNGSER